jgi:hypothetical protein
MAYENPIGNLIPIKIDWTKEYKLVLPLFPIHFLT